jgi:hypothetical protein
MYSTRFKHHKRVQQLLGDALALLWVSKTISSAKGNKQTGSEATLNICIAGKQQKHAM